MSTTTAAVERYQPSLTETEQLTLLGFLAGYRGYIRDAYTLDLRQYTAWCWQHHHRLFDMRVVSRSRASPVAACCSSRTGKSSVAVEIAETLERWGGVLRCVGSRHELGSDLRDQSDSDERTVSDRVRFGLVPDGGVTHVTGTKPRIDAKPRSDVGDLLRYDLAEALSRRGGIVVHHEVREEVEDRD